MNARTRYRQVAALVAFMVSPAALGAQAPTLKADQDVQGRKGWVLETDRVHLNWHIDQVAGEKVHRHIEVEGERNPTGVFSNVTSPSIEEFIGLEPGLITDVSFAKENKKVKDREFPCVKVSRKRSHGSRPSTWRTIGHRRRIFDQKKCKTQILKLSSSWIPKRAGWFFFPRQKFLRM